ncbi:MAG: hypothetical protein ABIY35_01995 [Chitinophagaceae bacterium]
MKKLLFILPIVLSLPVFAQKPLPADCPGIHEQLLLLQKSFPEMESFKKEKISGDKLITDWTTDLSLCNVSGILQLMFGNRVELSFTFDKKFTFTEASLKVLTNKLHDDIKNVFGATYSEKYDEQESGNEEDDEYFEEFKKYTWLKKETIDNNVQVNSIVLQFSEKDSKLSVSFLTYKEK